MQFPVSKNIKMPIYVQIREQIRHRIAIGELTAGTRLPPAKHLANNLQINRHTVLRAYSELERLGYVESMNGRGTFVRTRTDIEGQSLVRPEFLSQLDEIIHALLASGLTPERAAYLTLSRAQFLAERPAPAAPEVVAAFFECNNERLTYYASELRRALDISIRPILISNLDRAQLPDSLREVDLLITTFFHLVELRRKLRHFPKLAHREVFALSVHPHIDVLRQLSELPAGIVLGILYFEAPEFTELRLKAMVEHIEHAGLKNIRRIVPIYVRGRLTPEQVKGIGAVLTRPENLVEAQPPLSLTIPVIQYHNTLDQASITVLREVIRAVREAKTARISFEPVGRRSNRSRQKRRGS